MFSCEFCEISKNIFSYTTPIVTAFAVILPANLFLYWCVGILSCNIGSFLVTFFNCVSIGIFQDILVERLLLKISFFTSLSTAPLLLEPSLYTPYLAFSFAGWIYFHSEAYSGLPETSKTEGSVATVIFIVTTLSTLDVCINRGYASLCNLNRVIWTLRSVNV